METNALLSLVGATLLCRGHPPAALQGTPTGDWGWDGTEGGEAARSTRPGRG